MIRRALRSLFVGGIGLIACAAQQPTLTPTPKSLTHRRADILNRDISWIHDTIPILRFNPPFAYGTLRLQVESCSGLTRAGWPTFYTAPINPLAWIRDDDNRMGKLEAFYASDSQAIVFALGNHTVAWMVRHELLHWLAEPVIPPAKDDETDAERDARQHAPKYFLERCAHLVSERADEP